MAKQNNNAKEAIKDKELELELDKQERLRREAQKARSAQKKTNRPPAITEHPSLFD